MRDLYLLCAVPGTDPSIPRVLASQVPGADRILLPLPGALPHVDFAVSFSKTAVAFGETDLALLFEGVTGGRFVVPTGWNAYISRVTVFVNGTAGDITALTAKVFIGGTEVTAAGSVTVNPQEVSSGDGIPSPDLPYLLAGSAASPQTFDVRVTTNGASGSLGVIAEVIGMMQPAA